MRNTTFGLLVGLLVSGCASVINGSSQEVSVTTDPVVGATCELKNSEGTWYVTSPGSANVSRTKNDLNVTCTKDGYPVASVVVPSKFHADTVGNVLIGGIIGLGVDAATGANYGYETPIKVGFVGASSDATNGPPPTTAAAPDAEPGAQ